MHAINFNDSIQKISKENYEIAIAKTRLIKKFSAKQIEYNVRFKNIPADLIDSIKLIQQLFTSIVTDIRNFIQPDDRCKIYIDHPNFTDDIQTKFMKGLDLDAQMIIDTIARLMQSGKILNLDEKMKFSILIINNNKGGGIKRVGDYLCKKQCVVRIKQEQDDNLCALRAIIVGMSLINKDDYEATKDSRNGIQKRKALQLAFNLNLPIDQPLGLNEIKKIELYLKNYQLIVINGDNTNQIDYAGPYQEQKIILYLKDGHYDLIKSLPAFFNKRFYCFKCLKGYSCFENHPCNEVCKKCKDRNCGILSENTQIICKYCNVYCNSNNCLINHRIRVCGNIPKCLSCGSFKLNSHVCSGKWCCYCKTEVNLNHKCYILTEEENIAKNNLKKKSTKGYIFFDYEAMQTENGHVVNLVCAEKVCLVCIEKSACNLNCGKFHWKSNNEFCDWLFNEHNNNFIAIAHNMKSYDGYFILNYIVSNILPSEKLPEVLLNGGKILSIKFGNITIKDSINFIPMALSKLPKTFDLIELKKGYFPHFFNTPENQSYIGKIPDINFYGADLMNEKEREKFLSWYSKQNGLFNLQHELLEYCKSDVDILTKACLAFRSIFIDITRKNPDDEGVDPFSECVTIASACHFVFRRNFMPSNSIGLIPPLGYSTEATSHKAIVWLKYISLHNKISLQHSKNGGEKKIQSFKVDGWDEINSTVYEFHGCIFHGCPQCYRPDTFNPLKNETMQDTYKKHLIRIEKIKNDQEVKNLIQIWECEFDKKLKSDAKFAEFVENNDVKKPLNPRDALTGGRTNAFVLHHKGSIGYVDFTSLYPYIQKYGVFPLGHPKIITENFEPLENYFGLIFCQVLPPKNLYIPVLPYKQNGKLMFPLCRTCCELNISNCHHSESKRCLEGSWVILELLEAIKLGYKVIKIYEVWHYDNVAKYDKISKTGGLFTEYVNTFLKIKQEASGFPHWVKNEDDQNKYINDYFENEGIVLNKEKIKINPGLKTLSKLLLNSQWGRYAMNTDKSKCRFITEPYQLFNLLNNDQYEVTNLVFPNDNVGMCFFKDGKSMHIGSNQTNVVIAAFVTAQARIKLYSELRVIDRDIIYCDTDSVFYIKGRYKPNIGDYLGMFTNEIDPSEGSEIVEFVSAGPKNYSYKLDTGITHLKVKGFDLNFKASQKIDFEKIKHIVQNPDETVTIHQSNIKRDKNNWTVHTNNVEKIYRLVYDKRIILPNLETIPFGYKMDEEDPFFK